MNLEEFINESLRQIMNGVADAKKYGSTIGAEVNPFAHMGGVDSQPEGAVYRLNKGKGGQWAQNISFDVAVTTSKESSSEGGAKLSVAVFSLGGGKENNSTNSSVSRVQFTVPVFLP